MTIGPVDFQIMMPKANEVARIQSEEQQRMVGQTQQIANNSVKEANQDTRSVHTQSEAQKTVITEEQKKNANQGKKQGKKSGDSEDEENEKEKDVRLPQERHTIDIRI